MDARMGIGSNFSSINTHEVKEHLNNDDGNGGSWRCPPVRSSRCCYWSWYKKMAVLETVKWPSFLSYCKLPTKASLSSLQIVFKALHTYTHGSSKMNLYCVLEPYKTTHVLQKLFVYFPFKYSILLQYIFLLLNI